MTLIDYLKGVRDYRTQPDYELWVILLLVLMGTLSGCTGYRALAAFVSRHQAQLIEVLQLPYERLPSFSTLRRIMVRVDFEALTQAFNAWAQATFPASKQEQIAGDGKSIKATLQDYDKTYQDFVSIVSAFSISQGVVVGLKAMRNAECGENETVMLLLEQLDLKGVCFSLDALHTQKKPLSRSSRAKMIT